MCQARTQPVSLASGAPGQASSSSSSARELGVMVHRRRVALPQLSNLRARATQTRAAAAAARSACDPLAGPARAQESGSSGDRRAAHRAAPRPARAADSASLPCSPPANRGTRSGRGALQRRTAPQGRGTGPLSAHSALTFCDGGGGAAERGGATRLRPPDSRVGRRGAAQPQVRVATCDGASATRASQTAACDRLLRATRVPPRPCINARAALCVDATKR